MAEELEVELGELYRELEELECVNKKLNDWEKNQKNWKNWKKNGN